MSSAPSWNRSAAQAGKWLGLLGALLAAPLIACGTFATQFPIESAAPPEAFESQPTPFPTSTPIVIPTPVAARASSPAQGAGGAVENGSVMGERVARSQVALVVGERARVVAAGGVNVRAEASAQANVVNRLAAGALVRVLDGPFQNQGLFWWQVAIVGQDQQGMMAEGEAGQPFLEAAAGARAVVNRDPVVGDQVQVSVPRLNVRDAPGLAAAVIATLNQGMEVGIVEGPSARDGYDWFRVTASEPAVSGWAAAAISGNRALRPLE